MTSFYTYALRATLTAAATALVCGCTTTSSGRWEEPRTENAPYINVLVVDLSSSDNFRATLERLLAQGIGQNSDVGGTRAAASTRLVEKLKDAPRDRDSVKAMLTETNADALLLMRTTEATVKLGKSKQEKDKYLFSDKAPMTKSSEEKDKSWATPHTVGETDILPDTKIKGEMRGVLYDVADDYRVVYTVDVNTKYNEKGGEAIFILADNIATAVTEELRQQGLIK